MAETMKGCLKEFRATLQERNPMIDLLRLKQTGTVAEYHDQFVFLSEKMELFEGCIINLFLNGLKNEIQPSVRLFKPKIIPQAFVLAHLQECTLKTLYQKSTITLQKPHLQPTPTNLPKAQLRTFPIQPKISKLTLILLKRTTRPLIPPR